MRLAPTDVGIKIWAGFWLPTLGDPARAVQELEIVRKRFGDRMPYIAFLGTAYAAVGRQDSTRRILADIERRSRTEYFPKDQIAGLYFALGDRVRGLRALEQAIDEHHWWAPHLNNIRRRSCFVGIPSSGG